MIHTCDKCEIGFATYYDYKDHMEEEHDGLDRPEDATTYECDHCDEYFYAPMKLAQHIAQEHPQVEEMYFEMG